MLVFLIICAIFFLLMVIIACILLSKDNDYFGVQIILLTAGVSGVVISLFVLLLYIGAVNNASFYNNLYGTTYTPADVFFNGNFIKDYLHGTIQNINIDGLK